MNKIIVKIIAACASALMLLSFAGCCSNDGAEDLTKDKNSSVSQQANEEKFENIKDYVESDDMKTQIDSITGTLKDNGFAFKTYAEGDKIVFEYKFEKKVDEEKQVELIKDTVKSQQQTFENVLDYIKQRVNTEAPILKLVYLNSDGKEIYSTEISSK